MRAKTIFALSLIILILMFTSLPNTTGAQSPLPTPTPVPAGPSFGPPDNNTLFTALTSPLVILAVTTLFSIAGYFLKSWFDERRARQEKTRQEEEQRRKKALEDEAVRRQVAAEAQKRREITNAHAISYIEKLSAQLRDLKILDMDHPLDLEHTYIRLRVRTQAQRTYPSADQEREFTQTERDPNEWFALHHSWYTERAKSAIPPEDALHQYRHCAILGDPGAGKTTMLKYLTLASAQGRFPDLPTFPLFISLHEFTRSGFDNLLDFAAYMLDTHYGFPEARLFLEGRLDVGELFLLLDGLDEVNVGADEDETRTHYERAVSQIHTIATRFPQAPIVVTSRFAGWRGGLPASFHHLEVLDLGPDDIERFIANWFAQSDPERADTLQRELTRNARIATLAANPLLLALICIVYTKRLELPERRAELYRQCLDVLLNRWDASRSIQRTHAFTTDNKRDLLEALAWHFHQQGRRYFPRDELLQAIAAFLPQIGLPTSDDERILAEITAQHGLLKEQALGWYGFLHLTLQEYFAAVEAFKTAQLPTLLEHLYNPWWEEVILLFASQGDAAPLLRAILDQPEDIFHSNLRLAGRCLVGHPRVSDPNIPNGIRAELRTRLRAARSSHEGGLLARVLVELGDRDSVDALLAFLPDKKIDSGVRISIARALGELGERFIAQDLLSLLPKEKIDDKVREDIADALGELGERAIKDQLLALLYNRKLTSNVQERIAVALGTLGDRSIVSELLGLLSNKEIAIRTRKGIAAAVGALGDSSIASDLLPFLSADTALSDDEHDWDLREAIATAIGALGDRSIAFKLLALLPKEEIDYAARRGCAAALGILGERSVAHPLVDFLSNKEITDAVRTSIAFALGELGECSVVPRLLVLLRDEELDRNLRYSIAHSLGKLVDRTYIPDLLTLLRDEKLDGRIRAELAAILGELGERAVIPQLLAFLPNVATDMLLGKRVAAALNTFGERSSASELLTLLQDEQLHVGARQGVAITLGALGESSIAPQLVILLQNKKIDPNLRTFISIALGQLGDTPEIAEGLAALLPTSDIVGYIYGEIHDISRRAGVRVLTDGRAVPLSQRNSSLICGSPAVG